MSLTESPVWHLWTHWHEAPIFAATMLFFAAAGMSPRFFAEPANSRHQLITKTACSINHCRYTLAQACVTYLLRRKDELLFC